MRTTLTLEDDIVALVERRQTQTKTSLKAVVNEALRRGLAPEATRESTAIRFTTPTFRLGPSQFPNLDNVAEVLAVAEGDQYQ